MDTDKKEVIILVHGIWMKGPELLYLRYKLWRQGYKVYQFHYSSIFKSPEENSQQLYSFVAKINAPAIHFVAHSLGGIVLCHMFHHHEISHNGSVIMIASPVNGSAVAKYISNKKYLRFLLGKSGIKGLLGNVPAWDYKGRTCIIAGTDGFGIGKLLAKKVMRKPNDGTVNLNETKLKFVEQQYEFPRSHFLLLFSTDVVNAIIKFISKHY